MATIKDKPVKSSSKDLLRIGSTTVAVTNLGKLYWPAEKITKGDLVHYYDEIASVILPYLKNRPQSLHRFPNGIKDEGFFQKDLNKDKGNIPLWVKTELIFSESNQEHINYLVCNNKATLIYMANLGCIEINPWNSRIKQLENPDWLVIDLDPEDISFAEVVRVALETKKVLDKMEVDCYCKTSGATGLHIYVPLGAKYDYETAKNFAHLVARYVNEAIPEITSVERLPKKRQKKVYLDYLQNRKGQTLAAPYSVRPKPGAPVSTPLEWKEVTPKLNPTDFTMKNIFKRLDAKGDLWKPVLEKGADLTLAMKKIGDAGIPLVNE